MMQTQYSEAQPNVGTIERWGSIVGGSGLLVYALRNRALRLPALLLGGGLLWRGVARHSRPYEVLGGTTPPPAKTGNKVEKAVTINRPPEEVYRFWRQLENLPRFMSHLESVRTEENGQSHWKARVPGNFPVEWTAHIVEDQPNELITWETEPGSTVQQYGMVRFKPAPGGQGTEFKVKLRYSPPGGVIGEAIGQLFNGVTAQQIKEDIRRCKSILETGEAPTIEGQPAGR